MASVAGGSAGSGIGSTSHRRKAGVLRWAVELLRRRRWTALGVCALLGGAVVKFGQAPLSKFAGVVSQKLQDVVMEQIGITGR